MTTDAWTGKVQFSGDSGANYNNMHCTNCGSGTGPSGTIVFDKDGGGSSEQGAQTCFDKWCPMEIDNYCVEVVTGPEGTLNDGSLELEIDQGNGWETLRAAKHYTHGETVVSQCFATKPNQLRGKGPATNAWAGTLKSSTDSGSTYTDLICSNCGSSSGPNGIFAFDGNTDGGNMGQHTCLNGVWCNLSLQ